MSHKKTLAFHSTGCLIGILRMVCYNPHITGQYNLLYTINNQCPFFIAQVEPFCIHLQGFFDVSFQLLSIFFTSWLCFFAPPPLAWFAGAFLLPPLSGSAKVSGSVFHTKTWTGNPPTATPQEDQPLGASKGLS